MKETTAVVLEVDGIGLEPRINELKNFEANSIARCHVCQFDFLEGLPVNSEDGCREVL